ncbi:MAG: nickel pincer cofactor biosynthesis protein LarC [Eubacteriales bacterium]|nr:nickel pincer cofactor biosynthesis protein LarC [Eubacteriales bacterium]
MKTLYIDCGMGAAGDMLTAALTELLPDPEAFVDRLNRLGIPGVVFQREKSVKCGITGTHITVTVNGEEEGQEHRHEHGHDHGHEHEHHHGHEHGHHHSSLHDIEHIVREHLALPKKVQDDIMAVYGLIAEAESQAHGVPVSEIHFHEVGTMDAIADITAVCMLMDQLSVDEVVVSPVHVGSGQVKCAHGILPVPAPATAYILRDVPIYGGSIRGELCTPTGAALLRHFATRFGAMPIMRTKAIGYGMGKKDFEAANCVRVMLGETEASGDEICELSCNVDDMTGEAVGFAMDRLFDAGALDVYTMPIGMKKSRPGILLHVMCRKEDKETILRTVFKHTTTIGIRENRLRRYVLDRRMETAETACGSIRCKVSSGYGVERRKYEYEDVSRIAKENNLSIEELLSKVEK